MLHEYQNKGLTRIAFRRYLILKDMFLVVWGKQYLKRRPKKVGNSSRLRRGTTQIGVGTSGRSGIGGWLTRVSRIPGGVSDVWQTKDLKPRVLEVWQIKELRAHFRDVWQIKNLRRFLLQNGAIRDGKVNDSADTFTSKYMYHSYKKKSTVLLGTLTARGIVLR